ncbi:hypothetical protein [Sulfuricurvum sp.]|uniref:hypothetical protein n=1 Tax=Sulfuricurvum sp. TaxID=2025608 RepID=UPI00261C03EF|nr:hypothetical protein [Sulfuricurvum sp.]MDD2266155.1 hypothetical protein [Sulfuricurvum sp.]MDD2784056.1 hypothetical protein [Sulfuricurvum sp.]
MNIITFMTFAILVITILTLVFGVLAYFLYKIRESKKKVHILEEGYEEMLTKQDTDYIFFKKVNLYERPETN